MAKASAVGQITVISNGTTYNTLLQCNIGDIVQSYEGEFSSPTKISPDYTAAGATTPILMLMLFSSERGNGNALTNVDNSRVSWYINQTQLIEFDSNTGLSTNSFNGDKGHFKKTTASITDDSGSNITVPALEVKKNLVAINDGSSFTITAKCTAPVINSSVELSATYQCTITTAADVTKKVSIAADDSHPFTIMSKGGTCRVVALIEGTDTTDTKYSYAWSLFQNGAWVTKACVTSKPNRLDINEADVDSYTIVKVEVAKDGASFGSDIQTITDTSDPYKIYPNPKEVTYDTSGNDTDNYPDDYEKGEAAAETFTVGDGRTIRYKPILQPTSANQDKSQKYKMWLYDDAGNDFTPEGFSTPAKHFDVKSDVVAPHRGCTYIIQTTD